MVKFEFVNVWTPETARTFEFVNVWTPETARTFESVNVWTPETARTFEFVNVIRSDIKFTFQFVNVDVFVKTNNFEYQQKCLPIVNRSLMCRRLSDSVRAERTRGRVPADERSNGAIALTNASTSASNGNAQDQRSYGAIAISNASNSAHNGALRPTQALVSYIQLHSTTFAFRKHLDNLKMGLGINS
jgi:hypothetical protein